MGSPGLPDPLSHNAPLCLPAATSRAPPERQEAEKQNRSPKEVTFYLACYTDSLILRCGNEGNPIRRAGMLSAAVFPTAIMVALGSSIHT